MRKQKNTWKRLFYSLLIGNLVVILVIAGMIFWPVKSEKVVDERPFLEHDSSEFVVRTTKNNLNELVNAYLDKLLQGTKHQYSISLDDDVHLLGELPMFSTTVPLSIHLEPFVQEDGNVILKQKSISLGKLKLPNKKIMEYIKRYLTMPEWVQVDPENEEIFVAITEMQIKSNFKVSVEHFDLNTNHLAFKINVPYQTLGIDKLATEHRR